MKKALGIFLILLPVLMLFGATYLINSTLAFVLLGIFIFVIMMVVSIKFGVDLLDN
jgi:uncharacterized membrane protein